MKKNFITVACLLLKCFLYAHPGIGIVKDSKGFIYYTDLKHVWKLDPQTMNPIIVVKNVHTHELCIDKTDNLYGEHLWYNGEKADTWGHYTWQLDGNGRLDTIIGPKEGFLENYSFERDSMGNMYWVQRFKVSRFKKKSIDGSITIMAEGEFKDIRWMHVTPGGEIYFIDLTDLYKITRDGKVKLIASNLQERTSLFEFGSLKHNIFGIWLDRDENIFIAVTGGQVVKKITQDGKISIAAYSSNGWSPTGGLFDDAGNMWVLETKEGIAFKTRVRKITITELASGPAATVNIINKLRGIILPLLITALLFYLVFRFVKRQLIRRNHSIEKSALTL